MASLLIGVVLILLGLNEVSLNHERATTDMQAHLVSEVDTHGERLERTLGSVRSNLLLTANEPAFQRFFREPGSRRQKLDRGSAAARDIEHALAYLEELYPGIGEACVIDEDGEEIARSVRGEVAPHDDLSVDEEKAPFFKGGLPT
jgi:hypothetical protein